MIFQVDPASSKPVYQQLMDQVKLAIAGRRLRPGDKLPTVRDLAVQLRINRNTVARVYSELEREGAIRVWREGKKRPPWPWAETMPA